MQMSANFNLSEIKNVNSSLDYIKLPQEWKFFRSNDETNRTNNKIFYDRLQEEDLMNKKNY